MINFNKTCLLPQLKDWARRSLRSSRLKQVYLSRKLAEEQVPMSRSLLIMQKRLVPPLSLGHDDSGRNVESFSPYFPSQKTPKVVCGFAGVFGFRNGTCGGARSQVRSFRMGWRGVSKHQSLSEYHWWRLRWIRKKLRARVSFYHFGMENAKVGNQLGWKMYGFGKGSN